jgi:hypothetical protein
MTDRLSALLHAEAEVLDVPAPHTADIVHSGRRLVRHRRRLRAAGGVLCAAALVVAGLSAAELRDSGDGSALDPASAAQLDGWAVASGSTVLLGNGRTVEVAGKVKSVYYTSVGVLVRSGADSSTDAADSTYALVEDDGDVTDFGLELGDRVPGTDPDQPYLVYADATDRLDVWNIVVRDVRSGEIDRTIPVSGAFTWGGWVAPPVALSGSHVYVGLDDATLDVDLTSGAVTESATLPASTMPSVTAGREVIEERRRRGSRVIDVATGNVLLRVEDPDRFVTLAPGGGHAISVSWRTCTENGECSFVQPLAEVFDLAAGTSRTIDVAEASYGWTPQGDLLRVDRDSVDVCDPSSDKCFSTPVDVDGRDLKLGGNSYEA